MTAPNARQPRQGRSRYRLLGRARLGPRVAAWGVWLLLVLSLVYWGNRWWGPATAVIVPTPVHVNTEVDSAAVARALGAEGGALSEDTTPTPSSQHVLLGVATDAQGQGVALLSLDGQPAQAVRVGSALPDGWVLRSLSRREALLAPPGGGAGVQRLSVPEPQSALVSPEPPPD